ncbi:ATP-binding protein [Xanthomarina spongicola]|uniref:histidine kinase n=1 Tax=Xanthomarina spongicola TaxID=570520 RepID=A0A316DJU7_9FLAO|nr:ATP-binding protein [Xanthomarina spongicola]PWK17772.1 phospho-acceptor domain-containing protein [Xanthomarina spongicola]
MKLTKKIETEIWKIYDTWMQGYLNADVETYNYYFDEDYHFIGSTNNEEFLNKKDTTDFFRATGDQFAGLTDLRKETKTLEVFGEHVFLTHFFDAWFKNDKDWSYYGRFRFSSVMHKTKEGWRFIYQHFSMPDSKSEEGQTIGFDKVHLENQELREAILRRTTELEQKNRELEVETALERIRAQAVAMKESSDLLDIVVTMRNEFIKLGHEAHYFWHMMWLPKTYEKAMTSGDGSKIGFVMELPRHIHGDIPQLAKWEKSKKPTVVYAMNIDEAIDYVDKMVNLGDFQSIDPQAPTHDDIKHIGGLTFIMARTTHGEIGYSLPGIVKNPPAEDLDILIQFAGAFDLAHRRFLDLQKAEKQAKEVKIELALEKVRSRTMAMQHSDELQEASFLLDEQVRALGIKTWGCAFNIYGEKDSTEWFGNEAGILPTYTVPRKRIFKKYYQKGQKGESLFIQEFSGKTCTDHYEYMSSLPVIGDVLKNLKKTNKGFPTYQIDHVVYFKYGYLLFITKEQVLDAHDVFKRFAKVFEQTYTRFLDLQKAEAQAREAQIEASLERVRASSMAMHKSEELHETGSILFQELSKLGIEKLTTGYVLFDEEEKIGWSHSIDPRTGKIMNAPVGLRQTETKVMKDITNSWKKQEPFLILQLDEIETIRHQTFMAERTINFPMTVKQLLAISPKRLVVHTFNFKQGYLLLVGSELLTSDQKDMLIRFAKVFEMTYRRFLDLQKAEAQAKEAQIEMALEKVRSRTMAMQSSSELPEAANNLFLQVQGLGIPAWSAGYCIWEDNQKSAWCNMSSEGEIQKGFSLPTIGEGYNFEKPLKNKESFHVAELGGKKLVKHYDFMKTLPGIGEVLEDFDKKGIDLPTFQIFHIVYYTHGYLMFITYEPVPNDWEVFKRFGKVFEQTYTRFLDLQKAEAQAREAQIEASLERVRSQAMAMRKSDDLVNCTSILFDELEKLNLSIERSGIGIFNPETKDCQLWSIVVAKDGTKELATGITSLTNHPMLIKTFDFWKTQKSFTYTLEGKELEDYYIQVSNSEFILSEEVIGKSTSLKKEYYHYSPFGAGGLYFFSDLEPLDKDKHIIRRFAEVFDLTYTRYEDLQKAEAQAREAQIETALEKVRSRTMAMQKGEEVKDVVVLLYKELIALGVTNFATCGYVEINEETNRQATWVTSPGGDSLGLFHLPLTGDVHFDERYEAWKKQQTVFHQTVAGKERKKHLEYAITTFNSKEAEEMVLNQFPDPTVFYCFNFSHGYLHLVSGSYLTEKEETLLARFTRVFEQTYARFLDLQKAEEQTRTAQINLAVERVRAKALAMHKSEEIMQVVAKLKDEVMSLDIPDVIAATIFLNEGEDKVRMWDLSSLEKDDAGYEIPFDITFKLKKSDPHLYVKRVWENPNDYFLELQEAKDFKRIIAWLRENNKNNIADEVEEYTESTKLERLHHAVKKLNNGKLVIDLLNPPSNEMETILTKMGAAFDLAYKRFEDLQKAEAQARESQIEAALEKVRSRSLAMHKPEELQEVVAVVAEKLKELGVIFDAGGVILCTYFPDNKDVVHWIAVDDFSTSGRYLVPYFDNPIFSEAWDSKIRGDAFFSKEFPVEVKNDFFKQAFENSDYCKMPDDYKQFVLQADSHNLSAAWSKNSAIIIPSLTGAVLSESDAEIMKRFAKVFEQAYIRFMDLQKAEAQTRESQIEAALERVRSRSMAMHKSEEMLEVIDVVAKQLLQLNLKFETVSFGKNNQEGDFKFWIASKGQPKPMLIQVPFINSRVLNSVKEAQKKGINFIEDVFNSEENKEWSEHLIKFSELKNLPQEAKDFILNAPGFARSSFLLKSINLYVGNYRAIPFTKEENAIFSRFAHVFEQAYTRFLDLKKSEAQAREAQIEASLERVRSRTLAMQTSDELAETSVIVFKQLLELGIAPNRLFIGIVKSDNDTIEAWTTNEDGSKLAVHFSPQASKNKFIKKMLDGWKQQKKSLVIDMKGKELEAYFKYLNEDMKIPFIDGLKQKRRVQTIAYFSGGLIGMAAPVEQPDDTIHLLERFAAVFNLTYTRFKDLKIAEANAEKAEQDLIKLQAAKKSAEEALSELQLTQNQLIQSEKMASLGELTAGIAHEIQNPLNFVNNFSEVSKELLDEMLEEIENGDMEEVKAIMDDVIQNLEKINHHGKRADGIVKGMLQHSRSSTGTKDPTNINVLADEYLRLAYHGLRAKDKSFNATLETDYDDSIGNINVIPQDIGRVILNLLTNAFYVVNEKKQQAKDSYKPTVSLTTKKDGNWVAISVKDNGNGIPKTVLDKIFQPFFTTKPTGKGTGLGLSMSYDIVTKSHGGELKVETKQGEGTEFIITLPI